jgi:hypothetical protein
LIVEKPQAEQKIQKLGDYEYKISEPVAKSKDDEKIIRYMFDVHVEKPIESAAKKT